MTKVPCKTCAGSGQMALSELMEQTLAEVRSTPGLSASEMIDRFPGVGVTALNNRLEDLRGFGLLERKRRGHSYVYFPAGYVAPAYDETKCGWDGGRYCAHPNCPQVAKQEAAILCPLKRKE